MATKLMTAFRNLQKAKKKFCEGKLVKSAVKAQAANYVKSATAAGKTSAEAKRIADRVLKGGCKMSSSIAKKQAKKK